MATVVGFDEKKKRRITCESCTAIIEYTKSDIISRSYIKSRSYTDYGEFRETYHFINCPNCRKEISVIQ